MQDPWLDRHSARIRKLNKHPLNQAALRWLEQGEKEGEEMGPWPDQLHVLNFLLWSIEQTPTPPERRQAMGHHWELLEADQEEGLQYLLAFQGDGEPTMLAEELSEAKSLDEARGTIWNTFFALLVDDPWWDFPPWEQPYETRRLTGPIW